MVAPWVRKTGRGSLRHPGRSQGPAPEAGQENVASYFGPPRSRWRRDAGEGVQVGVRDPHAEQVEQLGRPVANGPAALAASAPVYSLRDHGRPDGGD